MVPTSHFSVLRTLVTRSRRTRMVHPDADASILLPRRIDTPGAAAQVASDLLRHHREDITLALYLDDMHRLVGTALVAAGWVQHSRLSARPILSGSRACHATSCVLVRYGRYRGRSATEEEHRTFGILAAACARHGLHVVDHLMVSDYGEVSSTFRGGP